MRKFPNKLTGANAGGPSPLRIRTRLAVRVVRFYRDGGARVKVLRSLALLATIVISAVVLPLALLPKPGSRHCTYFGIVNTLHQIDAAKQRYAIEHNLSAKSVISREQLLQYLSEELWNKNADYQINPIGVPPEAVLQRAFDGLPAKTVIRSHTNDSGFDIIPPS